MDNGQLKMDNAECPLCHTPLRPDDPDGHGDTVGLNGGLRRILRKGAVVLAALTRTRTDARTANRRCGHGST